MRCLCFLFLITLFVQVLGADEVSMPPDIKRIKDRGELVVAMINEDVPYFFCKDKDGKLFGFDVDLAKGIADTLGVKVRFHRKSEKYSDVVESVRKHEADLAISILSRTASRSQKVLFSRPYMIAHPALVVNRLALADYGKDTKPIELLKTNDTPIATLGGSSYEGYLKADFPSCKAIPLPDLDTCWENVRENKVVGFYYDEVELKTMLRRHPALKINLQTVILNDIDDPVAVATAWDNRHLMYIVNTYLEGVAPRPLQADDILDRYPDPKVKQEVEVKKRVITSTERRNVLIGFFGFLLSLFIIKKVIGSMKETKKAEA